MRQRLLKTIAIAIGLLVVVQFLIYAITDLIFFRRKPEIPQKIELLSTPHPSLPDVIGPHFQNTKRKPPEQVLPVCTRPALLGKLNVDVAKIAKHVPTFEEIAKANPQVKPGGRFRPSACRPENGRVAFIIPCRNREVHLRALINHLHPILQRQQLDYQIFVVEQEGNDTFNKAAIMNAAYRETRKVANKFDCYIFHDVDLLLEDDRGIYTCDVQPIHLSEYIDKFGYETFAFQVVNENDVIFGGAVSITPEVFEMINGYSNVYFGWGGEDEDIATRLRLLKFPVRLPDIRYYRYKMFKHNRDTRNQANSERFFLVKGTFSRMFHDGLNSLVYSLQRVEYLSTHTKFVIGVDRQKLLGSSIDKTELRKSWLDNLIVNFFSFIGQ